jgi:hypothetical protein
MKIGKKLFKTIKNVEGKKLKGLKKLAGKSPAMRLIKKGGALKAAKTVLPKLFGALKKGGSLKNGKVLSVVADLIGGAKNKKELAGVVKETLKGAEQVLTIMPVERKGSKFITSIGELAAKAQAQLAA